MENGDLVGVDAALDFPLFFVLPSVLKGFAAPQTLVDMYALRKQVEANIVSSHGEATRYFVTFLDNHDAKRRFYFVEPSDPTAYDDQLTAAVACLYSLQGIPCLYYGTEQKLHGGDGTNDELVREALWGKAPNPPSPFDEGDSFYAAIRAVAKLRGKQPGMRYGRQYFRPISGDGLTFAVSNLAPGILAFSRILNDEEIIIVVNTARVSANPIFVIVDATLHSVGTRFGVAFSNKINPSQPDPVTELGAGGTVTIVETDRSISRGPVYAIRVTLQSFEAQILTRSAQ
jgi:glycosidase